MYNKDKFKERFDVYYPMLCRIAFGYKVGLYNIIGNPKEDEIIDLYSIDTKKHCLPYFSLNIKF